MQTSKQSKRKDILLYGKHKGLADKYLTQETPLPLYICSACYGCKDKSSGVQQHLPALTPDTMNQTQYHWERCWDPKATWGASGARHFRKRLWDSCAFLSSRPVCLPRGLCLQSTAVYQACSPTSLQGARQAAVQTCLSTSGQRAAGAHSQEQRTSLLTREQTQGAGAIGSRPGGRFPTRREKYHLLMKGTIHGSDAFSAALFRGEEKCSNTHLVAAGRVVLQWSRNETSDF